MTPADGATGAERRTRFLREARSAISVTRQRIVKREPVTWGNATFVAGTDAWLAWIAHLASMVTGNRAIEGSTALLLPRVE